MLFEELAAKVTIILIFNLNNKSSAIYVILFFTGGIHAREWISPAVCSYIAYALLTSEAELIRNAAREYDWHIFPVTNPDGYVHSFEGGVSIDIDFLLLEDLI